MVWEFIVVVAVNLCGLYALPLQVVIPDSNNDTIRNSIDCTLLQRGAPPDAQWIPHCDPDTNQLTPHQVAVDGLEFCVDSATGVNIFGPVNHSISCECVIRAYKILLTDRKPAYLPQCSTKNGDYLAKQCADNGDCWCVDKHGTQLGPRWSSTPVNAQQRWEDPVHATVRRDKPRLSCGMVRKFWESWKL
ncbi:uncharacterized protein LOC129584286 [Paramacrobiotus metropolitanus]|uniref:uncharacterized protein LOC129584286 n=1 Tax=Paramacrobiotus metropolitanus TaxID=2943436 RepID=UPI002445D7D2|nr:uncharacterized protein LOC129584286 [Paramacrobiotus metropolitanus]